MSITKFLLIALLTTSCGDTVVNVPTAPTPTQTPVTNYRIGFRVTGNAELVRIRYATERDGIAQLVTALPFFSSFSTSETSLFLSLEVTPLSYSGSSYPFLSAQILVDGNLFREAVSSDTGLNTLAVSGTWRK